MNYDFDSWIYPLMTILGTVFILGIVFNLVSIFSIVLTKAFTLINILIINLAIADITYALGIPMFLMHTFSENWSYGLLGCRIFFFFDYIGMTVGVFTITALSVERFFQIVYKKRFEMYSKKFKMLIVCVFLFILWIVAILFPLPMILSVQLVIENETTACRSTWNDQNLKVFFIVQFIFTFLFPFITITISSTRLLMFFRKWRKNSIKRRIKFADKTIGKVREQGKKYGTVNAGSGILKADNLTINTSNNLSSISKIETVSNIENMGNSPIIQPKIVSTNKRVEIRQKKSSLVMLFSSIMNILQLCKISRTKKTPYPKNRRFKRSIRKKASRLVMIIILTFFIQWVPLWILNFFKEFFDGDKTAVYLANILITVFSYTNTVANPVIYMLVTYNFKVNIKKFLKIGKN